jgi:hypothetical protein
MVAGGGTRVIDFFAYRHNRHVRRAGPFTSHRREGLTVDKLAMLIDPLSRERLVPDAENMKRKLFFAAAFISLLLCAGCVWWWVGSSARMDHFTFQGRDGHAIHVLGSGGKVMFTRSMSSGSDSAQGHIDWGSVPYAPGSSAQEPQLQWTSFTYTTRPLDKSGGMESTLILPAWALAGASSLLPLMWGAGKLKPKKKAH